MITHPARAAHATAHRGRSHVTAQVLVTEAVMAVDSVAAAQLHFLLTVGAGKRGRAVTPEVVHEISAGSSVSTRVVAAVIDVILAEGSVET